jgi:hypothetical protein
VRRALTPICLAAAVTLTLAACGGDDGGGGLSSDEKDDITAVLERTQTTSDPAHCTEDYTEHLVEKVGGLAECRDQERAGGEPDSIDVESLEGESGESATAVTVAHGGNFDGYEATLQLVFEDDRWKIDDFSLQQQPQAGATQ